MLLLLTNIVVVKLKKILPQLTKIVLYTCLVSFDVLQFSNESCIVSSDHKFKRVRVASSDHNFPRFFPSLHAILQCEKQDACVIINGSADPFLGGPRLPPEEVSARLKFWVRGPLILRLHDKNQECRAQKNGSACQDLSVPCPK